MDTYDSIYNQDSPKSEASGWIQWKGTDVCMDIVCKCGMTAHVDGDFFYSWRCPTCSRIYATGQNVKMIELTAQQALHFGDSVKEVEPHED